MAINSREELAEYCLRALGKPVITVDVEPTQLSDRLDEALSMYAKYHFDGTNHVYYKHAITDQDKVNGYITLPENILGAVRIFPLQGSVFTGTGMFDIRYQLVMSDLYSFQNTTLAPYTMIMTRMNEIQELLIGQIPIRYNKVNQKLYLDMDWKTQSTGHFIIVEAYEVVDPEEFTGVYDDLWLKKYSTQLIKRQWATNLSKFANMQLPGGIVLNAAQMMNEANAAIEKLEEELEEKYMWMPLDRMA